MGKRKSLVWLDEECFQAQLLTVVEIPLHLSLTSVSHLQISWWRRGFSGLVEKKWLLRPEACWDRMPPVCGRWKALPGLGPCGKIPNASAPQPSMALGVGEENQARRSSWQVLVEAWSPHAGAVLCLLVGEGSLRPCWEGEYFSCWFVSLSSVGLLFNPRESWAYLGCFLLLHWMSGNAGAWVTFFLLVGCCKVPCNYAVPPVLDSLISLPSFLHLKSSPLVASHIISRVYSCI